MVDVEHPVLDWSRECARICVHLDTLGEMARTREGSVLLDITSLIGAAAASAWGATLLLLTVLFWVFPAISAVLSLKMLARLVRDRRELAESTSTLNRGA